MSQAANTFWINQSNSSAKVSLVASRRLRLRRLIDGMVMMIIFASAATCASVYWRTRAEISVARVRHQAAFDRVEALRVETERLEQDVKRLKADPRFIETFARQNMGLVRAGDIVIKIEQDQNILGAGGIIRRPANLTP